MLSYLPIKLYLLRVDNCLISFLPIPHVTWQELESEKESEGASL